jgi:dolichol-phosphate mannosyltransferase
MKLSVIIPVYNEEATIKNVIEQIFALHMTEIEVIVVDDGSTDKTRQIVENCGFPVLCIRQEKNKGKGAAIRLGLSKSSGEIILIQDADCEYSPDDYSTLIQPILSGKAFVVYGSRILNKNNRYSYKRFYFGGRLLSLWTNLLYGSAISDEPTGYKVFKAELIKSLQLQCEGFEFCPEVTAKILKRGIKIEEIPISYNPRSISEGKKIKWTDGLFALWLLLKIRFRNN